MSSQYITTKDAAPMLHVGDRRVRTLCGSGFFKTAHKPGWGVQAHWLILQAEVVIKAQRKQKQKG